MRKLYAIILILMLFTGCTTSQLETKITKDQLTVAVSILPQKAFVEAVAQDKISVVTMIPPGSSPEVYQPTTKQMQQLSEADIYFAIDVPSEQAFIVPKLNDFNKDILLVDLFHEVDEVYEPRSFEEEGEHDTEEDTDHAEEDEHTHEGYDPHIWMSPKRVEVMVQAIADTLAEVDPNNKDFYKENADSYIKELKEVDSYIKNQLVDSKESSFIIYHPSLGYYADDYELNMIAIEVSGKEATAKEIEDVIELAKEKGINVIFYQAEFSSKQSEIIAGEIGGTVIQVDILSENYIENIKAITDIIATNAK